MASGLLSSPQRGSVVLTYVSVVDGKERKLVGERERERERVRACGTEFRESVERRERERVREKERAWREPTIQNHSF